MHVCVDLRRVALQGGSDKLLRYYKRSARAMVCCDKPSMHQRHLAKNMAGVLASCTMVGRCSSKDGCGRVDYHLE